MGTDRTPVLGALSSSTKMIEVVILAVVVILLATVLVLYRRSSRPKSGAGHAATAPSTASYYSDVGTLPAPSGLGGSFGGQSDPFAGFGGGSQFGGAPAAPPPPPPPAPVAQPSMPAPGTPASWLPDPAGAPDTLRYWDGMSWTQHVAKRN